MADPSFALAYYRGGLAKAWNGDTTAGVAFMEEGRPHIGRLPKRWQVIYQAYLDLLDGKGALSFQALNELLESSAEEGASRGGCQGGCQGSIGRTPSVDRVP